MSLDAGKWELIGRLLMALALGALVGWDRQRRDKPAGVRTHMLVTLGSASFSLLAIEVGLQSNDPIDPTRVIQGVVGGIGFLGAGSIIRSRGHVRGITTAASVWVCGAIGVACAVGAYIVALSTACLSVITLAGLPSLNRGERKLDGERAQSDAEDEESKPTTGL